MKVREMNEGDIEAVATLRVRGWQYAYRGLMPQEHLDAMSVAGDAARRREMFARADGSVTQLVAEGAAGDVVGWAALGPYRDEHENRATGDGELYALYVRPEEIGTGVGRILLTTCLGLAAERGFPRLLLWVVKGNTRARRFYERAGLSADGAEETYPVAGARVPEVRYGVWLEDAP